MPASGNALYLVMFGQTSLPKLEEENHAIAGLDPLAESLTDSFTQTSQSAKAVPVLENAQVAAREAGGIAADGHRVADHAEQELDRSKRWWEKVLPAPIIWAARGVHALWKAS